MAAIVGTSGFTGGYVGSTPVNALFLGSNLVWAKPLQELSISLKNIDPGVTMGQIIVRQSNGKMVGYSEYNATNHTVSSGTTSEGFEILQNRWINGQSYTFEFYLKGPFYGTYNISDASGDVIATANFSAIGDYQEIVYDYDNP